MTFEDEDLVLLRRHIVSIFGSVLSIEICFDRLVITLQDDYEFKFEDLEKLSVLLETRNINLGFRQAEGDYSEYTPGAPAEFRIVAFRS